MSTPSGNPFLFPGMGPGQTPDPAAGNPILQSLDMMRQAWAPFGGAAGFAGKLPTPPVLNVEELDRRIQELRTVENWLNLNLTMLRGSIQAMEVQRATISTLQSFATMGGAAAGASASGEPSPLEVALGMKPGRAQPAAKPTAPAAAASAAAAPAAGANEPAATDPAAAPAASPQQAWWNMLQNQFNQIASAAAATLPAQAPAAAGGAARVSAPPAKAAPRKRASKSAARNTTPKT